MKKSTLISLIFTALLSTSALAKSGICTLNLVNENGNFPAIDKGPSGRVTLDVMIPYTDGFYPNVQPRPMLPFSNCIKYGNTPSNALIKKVDVDYTFKKTVLVADYSILMGFLGRRNFYKTISIRGGGKRGTTLHNSRSFTTVKGHRLSEMGLDLRAAVLNPKINDDCNRYTGRDQCRTRNTRLTHFTAKIFWSTN